MSELIITRLPSKKIRHDLLAQASILAVLASAGVALPANAASDDAKSTVWIEVGGSLERIDTKQAIFSPPFFDVARPAVLDTLIDAQRPSRYGAGFEGAISISPKGTDWIFSVAARYGQTKNARHLHYETPGLPTFHERLVPGGNTITPRMRNFGDGQNDMSNSDLVLDFKAGKDVSLGLFGSRTNSVMSVGVRYAQFVSHSDINLHARPILGYSPPVPYTVLKYHGTVRRPYYQTNYAVLKASRSTRAIGPAIALDGSAPLAGHDDAATLSLDWGVNAAVLFGRQRVRQTHRTTGHSVHFDVNTPIRTAYDTGDSPNRSQTVVIPNVGASLSFSLKFPNAKVSMGYRGDFFFNATDIGIDGRHAANRAYYGPFATISIGLGE